MTQMLFDNKPMLASLRSAFLAGLVLMAPIAVTLYVVNILVTAVGGGFRDTFFGFFVPTELLTNPQLQIIWNLLATLLVLGFITALGYISRWFLGRFIVNTTERIIERLPFINTVYNSVKQIVQTFSTQEKAIFQEVVMIEYPRKGVFVLGFRTSTSRGEVQQRTDREMHNVFIPTTPNPTSGFLLMVPVDEITELEMTVGEGMKLIISGGAVVPEFRKNSREIVAVNTATLHGTKITHVK
jgi:uncharacterized membrane protein